MKTLILYYSYGGNTKRIAEMIHKEIGGDIVRMDTVVPYDGDYYSGFSCLVVHLCACHAQFSESD